MVLKKDNTIKPFVNNNEANAYNGLWNHLEFFLLFF